MKISVSELRWLAETSTFNEIVVMTEMPRSTTWHRLKRFGIKARPGYKNPNTKWSPEEDEIIIRGMRSGIKTREIAKQLPGRNRNMVLGRWHRIKGAA